MKLISSNKSAAFLQNNLARGSSSSSISSTNNESSTVSSAESAVSSSPPAITTNIEASEALESDTIILFARTDREKEEWFKLFKKAAARSLHDSNYFLKLKEKKNPFQIPKSDTAGSNLNSIVSNNLNLDNLIKSNDYTFSYSTSNDKIIYKLEDKKPLSLSLSNSSTSGNTSVATTPNSTGMTNSFEKKCTDSNSQTENALVYDSSLAFMNTFLIRLFADFFTHQYWISKIQTKMQNKLNTIKMPYFMEELKITDLDLGK